MTGPKPNRPLGIRLESGVGQVRAGEIRLLAPLTNGQNDGLELPVVSPDIAEAAIVAIHDLHRALADANPNQMWWYLPVAEWQPAMSSLPEAVDLEARIRTLGRELGEGRYVLAVANSVIAYYLLERFAGDRAVSIAADWVDRVAWRVDRAKDIGRRWFNSVAWMLENIGSFKAKDEDPRIPANVDTLLISRMERAQVARSQDHWEDSYLGDLPNEAQRRTGSVALLLRCPGFSKQQVNEIAQFRRFPVVVMSSLLRRRKLFSALSKALSFRLETEGAESVLARAARREARNHVRAIADWVVMEASVAQFLTKCDPRQIICMQENSGWEQAVVIAARRLRPKTIMTGVFHCPVMPAAFRYRTRADVRDRRPLFHRTVPLGLAHRAALLQLGDWTPLLSECGYAFRNPQLDACYGLTPATAARPFTILIVLGGAFDNAAFMRWVALAMHPMRDIVIEIKPHPAYDYRPILRKAGVMVDGTRFRIAPEKSVDRVLERADLVLYKGTTVCFAALAAGVPVVHVSDGGIATDDALFASRGLTVEVATADELHNVVGQLRAQSLRQREEWAQRARVYVRQYYDMSETARETVLSDLFPQTS